MGVVEGAIAAFFDHGHSFGNILLGTPLCWLNLDQIMALPNYAEFFVWAGLSPAFDPERCPDNKAFNEESLEMMMNPQSIADKVMENLNSEVDSTFADFLLKLGAKSEEIEAEMEEYIAIDQTS